MRGTSWASALANKWDLSAKEGKKNLGYSISRNSSNQAKKNLPCSSKGSSSTTGTKNLGSKKTKEYSRSGTGKVSTIHLICKMDRGEEITCIQNGCNRAVTRASQYKCQNCNIDNLGTLNKTKLRESLDTFKVPNPLFDIAEYKVPKKANTKRNRLHGEFRGGGKLFTSNFAIPFFTTYVIWLDPQIVCYVS